MKKSGRKASGSKRSPADDPASLAHRERAELQRQGAKAAARGEQPSSNPMNREPNLPAATGESADTWRQRQEAWQQGHDAQAGTPDAPPPPAGSKEADDDAAKAGGGA